MTLHRMNVVKKTPKPRVYAKVLYELNVTDFTFISGKYRVHTVL